MTVSLADHLRSLPDDQLARLIRLRTDLVTPLPGDFEALAERVRSRYSVSRALDGLDRFTLQILDALRFTRAEDLLLPEEVLCLTNQAGVPTDRVRQAIEALWDRCLIFGDRSAPRMPAAVDDSCWQYPAGLGRPAATLDPEAGRLAADAARLRRTLLSAPPPARAILDRLAEGPPVGVVSPASLSSGSESTVRWLLDAHLLVSIGDDCVELPQEVGLLLRRDTGPLGHLEPFPPPLPATSKDPDLVDQAGAGQALEAVRWTELLLEAMSTDPPGSLRSGGLGVRDLRRLAKIAGTDETTAALLLEVSSAAGLLGSSSLDTGDLLFMPAAGFDAWRAMGMASRWLRLASAWLAMTRAPSLIGTRDDRRLISALSYEVEQSFAPARRRAVLGILADQPAGTCPEPAEVVEALIWHTPRRVNPTVKELSISVLDEAATLGITGLGSLTRYSRLLLAELAVAGEEDDDPLGIHIEEPAGPETARGMLDQLLPDLVDQVLLQADLTVVVPGPPELTLAAELAMIADQESTSVYRITRESMRRALDAGMSPDQLRKLLEHRSSTPVPQALLYLVEDVARQHGGIRVGGCGAYLRSEDEPLLSEVLANRRLATLGLRRLAPTVLVAGFTSDRLVKALRDAGYAPVSEDATGDVVLVHPRPRRASPRPPVSRRRGEDLVGNTWLAEPVVTGVISQLRRGEALARNTRRAPEEVRRSSRTSGAAAVEAYNQAMAVLQQALHDRAKVWVGYVDAHGAATSRLLLPLSMSAGYLRAEDERTETVHTLALHRITAAVVDRQ